VRGTAQPGQRARELSVTVGPERSAATKLNAASPEMTGYVRESPWARRLKLETIASARWLVV